MKLLASTLAPMIDDSTWNQPCVRQSTTQSITLTTDRLCYAYRKWMELCGDNTSLVTKRENPTDASQRETT